MIPKLTSDQALFMRRAMSHCKLTTKKLAEEMSCSESAVAGWYTGRNKMRGTSRTLAEFILNKHWPRDANEVAIPMPEEGEEPKTKKATKATYAAQRHAETREALATLRKELMIVRKTQVVILEQLAHLRGLME